MILVTGGTGLVGSQLLRQLVQGGHRVRAMKRKTSRFNLVSDIKDRVEWMEGDVLDIPSLERMFEGVTHVYHCAGVVGFHPGAHDKVMRVNLEGTANIINFAVDYDVEKLVHVSSIAALGHRPPDELITERTDWQQARYGSRYGLSKFLGEREVWRGVGEGLEAAIVNPGIVIGPGNWKTDSSAFFRTVWNGLKFYPVGTTGFVDAKDVARAMIRLMESDIMAERFILTAGNWSYKRLLTEIANHLGTRAPRIPGTFLMRELIWRLEAIKSRFTNRPPLITKETVRSSARKLFFDNSKVRSRLNFTFTPLPATIAETAQKFLEEQ